MYETGINYQVGDDIVAKEQPEKVIGKCTGFSDDDTCIVIDGKVWGGKYFFMKSEWQEVQAQDKQQ
jgi:hypothetical protein